MYYKCKCFIRYIYIYDIIFYIGFGCFHFYILEASLSFDEHCQRRKGGLTVSRCFRNRPTGEDNGSPIAGVGPAPEMRNVFGALFFLSFILQQSFYKENKVKI